MKRENYKLSQLNVCGIDTVDMIDVLDCFYFMDFYKYEKKNVLSLFDDLCSVYFLENNNSLLYANECHIGAIPYRIITLPN